MQGLGTNEIVREICNRLKEEAETSSLGLGLGLGIVRPETPRHMEIKETIRALPDEKLIKAIRKRLENFGELGIKTENLNEEDLKLVSPTVTQIRAELDSKGGEVTKEGVLDAISHSLDMHIIPYLTTGRYERILIDEPESKAIKPLHQFLEDTTGKTIFRTKIQAITIPKEEENKLDMIVMHSERKEEKEKEKMERARNLLRERGILIIRTKEGINHFIKKEGKLNPIKPEKFLTELHEGIRREKLKHYI